MFDNSERFGDAIRRSFAGSESIAAAACCVPDDGRRGTSSSLDDIAPAAEHPTTGGEAFAIGVTRFQLAEAKGVGPLVLRASKGRMGPWLYVIANSQLWFPRPPHETILVKLPIAGLPTAARSL